MNHRTLIASAAALLVPFTAAVALAAPASASSGPRDDREHQEHIVLRFSQVGDTEAVTTVVAKGPVTDRGYETQSNEVELPDGMRGDLVLHLRHGDLVGTFDEHHFTLDLDLEACTAVSTSDGTMTFTGGTGRYRETHGTLAFTVRGDYVAQRGADGTCLGTNADPASVVTVVDAWGDLDR